MKDFRELLVEMDYDCWIIRDRKFHHLRFGKYQISVQASYFYNCIPRLTLAVMEYTAMEIAIFEVVNNELCWIVPIEDCCFKDFRRLNELISCFEEGDIIGCIGMFVEIDLIQDLCEYLDKKAKEETIDI